MKRLFVILILAGGIYHFWPFDSSLSKLAYNPCVFIDTDNAGLEIVSNDDQESIDIQALAEPGLFTVVEFYTDTCPGCKQLGQ